MSDAILKRKFISLDALSGWVKAMGQNARVYAPKKEGAAVVYRPVGEDGAVELLARPTESAKHVVFPRTEALFTFKREGDPENPDARKLSLEEAQEPGETVIFGALSCDARGFFAFDPVYNGSGTKDSTKGPAKDVYYLKRRSKTAIVVKACKSALRTCFCNWVGGDPASPMGADVLMTETNTGLVLEAYTEKGAALLDLAGPVEADDAQVKAAATAQEAVRKSLSEAPKLENAPKALLSLFDNAVFWQGQSAACLSCGACTYLCPTCYCFNITDETNGIDGTRIRTWDNCMSPLFTLEASGHNPRVNKAARLKNRVGHKYSYYPQLHEGRFSCTGCGRCIKSCPSSIDIRKIVLSALKEAADV
ncbi:4Fe-4S dicluster domain-containing protein [Desulfovibrio sp. OttesenSCG-928-G15]|nr:4Fe-4S dicluster domain-containing protein [Desulfovibrio sp. OttesenSCG-928-G15]